MHMTKHKQRHTLFNIFATYSNELQFLFSTFRTWICWFRFPNTTLSITCHHCQHDTQGFQQISAYEYLVPVESAFVETKICQCGRVTKLDIAKVLFGILLM